MKFTVILEVEVENASTESEARKAAYDLAATLNQAPKKRRGRKGAEAAAAVASVVGIRVEAEEKCCINTRPLHPVVKDYMAFQNPADAMEVE
jgi:hypothetical protein